MRNPIRVLGRIDLAVQVWSALRSAGVEADLHVGAPAAAGAGIGPGTPGVDVIAYSGLSGADFRAAIRRAAPSRPVVAVSWPEAGTTVATAAQGRRGPHAHLAWPATGQAIAEACDRAPAAGGVRRPLLPRALWPETVALGLLLAALVACALAVVHWRDHPVRAVPVEALVLVVLGLVPVLRARHRAVFHRLNLVMGGAAGRRGERRAGLGAAPGAVQLRPARPGSVVAVMRPRAVLSGVKPDRLQLASDAYAQALAGARASPTPARWRRLLRAAANLRAARAPGPQPGRIVLAPVIPGPGARADDLRRAAARHADVLAEVARARRLMAQSHRLCAEALRLREELRVLVEQCRGSIGEARRAEQR
ncbi:MAG: hypothetical protein QM767_04175 [Anaeromyxobacter sp.]